MKKLILFALLILTAGSTFRVRSEEQILGEWLTEDQKAKVRIFRREEDNRYYGSITWLREPLDAQGVPKLDKNNKDVTKRNQAILGLAVLKGFLYAKNNKWEDGHVYNPDEGKDYSCTMALKEEGTKLEIRGYIGVSFFGRKTVWTRVGL